MKVTVDKCPHTGQLFEDNAEYLKHLARLSSQRRRDRKHKEKMDAIDTWLAEEKAKITRIEDIPAWVLDNQPKLMEACNFKGFNWYEGHFYPDDSLVKFFFENIRFQDPLSNTHDAPVGGVTNFNRVAGKPVGYPGYQVRLNGSLKRRDRRPHGFPIKNLCRLLNLNTGTGGGSNENWGYETRIFISDWPGLWNQWASTSFDNEVARYEREKERIISRLQGKF